MEDSYDTGLTHVRKRILAIAVFGVLGGAVGWASSDLKPDMYTSTAYLLVSPYQVSVLGYQPAALSLNGNTVVLETQMQLLRSVNTVDRVVKALVTAPEMAMAALNVPKTEAGLREYVANNLSVKRANAAEIIDISFTAQDPALAAFIANEVVAQFLQGQRDDKSAELQRIGDELQKRVDALAEMAQQAEAAVADAREATPAGGTAGEQAALEQAALERAMATLEANLEALDALRDGDGMTEVLQTIDGSTAAISGVVTDLQTLAGSLERPTREAVDVTTRVREAEVKANVHREMLQRLLEIRELSGFVSDDARVVAPAVAAVEPSNVPREVLAAMGFLSFVLLGAMVAFTGRQRGGTWS